MPSGFTERDTTDQKCIVFFENNDGLITKPIETWGKVLYDI